VVARSLQIIMYVRTLPDQTMILKNKAVIKLVFHVLMDNGSHTGHAD